MKKFIFSLVAVAAVLAGCEKNKDKSISVSVNVDETALEVEAPESYLVTMTNTGSGTVFSAETENGVATLSVVPGLYTVFVEGSSTVSGFTYTISGAVKDVALQTAGEVINVPVAAVKSSDLVIKEFYQTGCGDYYFRDQFYEIYNNSDHVVYVDGLCVAYASWQDSDGTPYTFEIDNPENYVFTNEIWQVPGDGTMYPLQPGESFVIAQWAADHRLEANSSGASQVDLSGAEFELIQGESTMWNGLVITDGPSINMERPVNSKGYAGLQYLNPVSGSPTFIFFPLAPFRTEDWVLYTGQTFGGFQEIPLDWIIDAIETVPDEASLLLKGFPASIDAGAIYADGMYTGQSFARKVETTVDGRNVYKDTNNSANDFEVKDTPMVRRNGDAAPAWNTWLK